jgi:hypothetical protein
MISIALVSLILLRYIFMYGIQSILDEIFLLLITIPILVLIACNLVLKKLTKES